MPERELNFTSISANAEFTNGYEVVYEWSLYYCTATIYYYGRPLSSGSGVGTTAAEACARAEVNAWRNMK